jgi:hypothetical protein
MAHRCPHIQAGSDTCAEHMLAKEGLRYRFRKQLEDTMDLEELVAWHELMTASMLPSDRRVPLDDRPQWYIEKVAKGGVNT